MPGGLNSDLGCVISGFTILFFGMDFLFLFAGIAVGALMAWFYAKSSLVAQANQNTQQAEARLVAAHEKNLSLALNAFKMRL